MTKKLQFRSDYGVYLCPHVFRKERPILEVVRDPDGCWQFFCGEEHDFDKERCHLVGVGHLVEHDSSIEELVKMEKSTYAERKAVGDKWVFGTLHE